MTMDEFSVVMRARKLVRTVNSTSIPASVEAYAEQVGAVVRVQMDLDENEPGWSFEIKGKKYICVNGNDSRERQRFTVCHELAHIVLGLPSDHQEIPSSSFVKKIPGRNLLRCVCSGTIAAASAVPALGRKGDYRFRFY